MHFVIRNVSNNHLLENFKHTFFNIWLNTAPYLYVEHKKNILFHFCEYCSLGSVAATMYCAAVAVVVIVVLSMSTAKSPCVAVSANQIEMNLKKRKKALTNEMKIGRFE